MDLFSKVFNNARFQKALIARKGAAMNYLFANHTVGMLGN